jgi:hypothetical protein
MSGLALQRHNETGLVLEAAIEKLRILRMSGNYRGQNRDHHTVQRDHSG